MSEPYRGIVVNGKLLSPDARFAPWPLPKLSPLTTGEITTTGTKAALSQGFISNSRFGSDRVISRTNRASTRKWRNVK